MGKIYEDSGFFCGIIAWSEKIIPDYPLLYIYIFFFGVRDDCDHALFIT